MADDEIERLRAEIEAAKLRGLQDDRAEILEDLDTAEGDEVTFLEIQLAGVEEQIAALLDRRGLVIQEDMRKRPRPEPPASSGQLF
ncbi:hypothetical protein [Nocardia sp. NBC_01388]|uniref:hypothetical protein n=1 Tax=Nocardia sp. NBC_01388 TaxID=2903596 RepID=UPI0032474C39